MHGPTFFVVTRMVHFFRDFDTTKNRIWKKADSLWLKAYRWLFRMNKSDEEKNFYEHKNDALVLSASINAFKMKIYGVCT